MKSTDSSMETQTTHREIENDVEQWVPQQNKPPARVMHAHDFSSSTSGKMVDDCSAVNQIAPTIPFVSQATFPEQSCSTVLRGRSSSPTNRMFKKLVGVRQSSEPRQKSVGGSPNQNSPKLDKSQSLDDFAIQQKRLQSETKVSEPTRRKLDSEAGDRKIAGSPHVTKKLQCTSLEFCHAAKQHVYSCPLHKTDQHWIVD